MSPEFVKEWSGALRVDRHYRSIFAELQKKMGDADEVESYGWLMKKVEGELLLFVYKGDHGGLRACIPTALVKNVLMAAHDLQAHPGIDNTFSSLGDHFYMPRMSA
jgi:hypothetical protein